MQVSLFKASSDCGFQMGHWFLSHFRRSNSVHHIGKQRRVLGLAQGQTQLGKLLKLTLLPQYKAYQHYVALIIVSGLYLKKVIQQRAAKPPCSATSGIQGRHHYCLSHVV